MRKRKLSKKQVAAIAAKDKRVIKDAKMDLVDMKKAENTDKNLIVNAKKELTEIKKIKREVC